jgi:hypothetical protein
VSRRVRRRDRQIAVVAAAGCVVLVVLGIVGLGVVGGLGVCAVRGVVCSQLVVGAMGMSLCVVFSVLACVCVCVLFGARACDVEGCENASKCQCRLVVRTQASHA